MSLAETETKDPFETWMADYGHRPHDLYHAYTRLDMGEAFKAGMTCASRLLAGNRAGTGDSSLTAGPRELPCESETIP